MRHFLNTYPQKLMQALALSATVFFSSASHAVPPNELAIANTPLFLGFAVPPNVFFVTDDSGSMDWEFMTGGHWTWANYDPFPTRESVFRSGVPGGEVGAFKVDGQFRSADFLGATGATDGKYGYIYDNGNDNVTPGRTNCSTNAAFSRGMTEFCAGNGNHPLDVDWRGRANGLNRVFYNTNILYEPWDGPCDATGTACGNARFTAAKSNPHSAQTGFGIERDLSQDGDANNGPFIYEVWIDDSGYGTVTYRRRPGGPLVTEARPGRGSNFNATGYAASSLSNVTGNDRPNEIVDLWDSHMRFIASDGSIDVQLIAYNPISSGASQGLNETGIGSVTTLAGTACYNVLGNKSQVRAIRDQIIAAPANAATLVAATGTPGCRTVAETTQNIANWYQYYRRRAFPVKNAIAEVMDSQPDFRFGLTVINEGDDNQLVSLFRPVPDQAVTTAADLAAHNEDIKQKYFSYPQAFLGTPLRQALQSAGQYFDGTLTVQGADEPIIESCQKNFTILLTDGFWNGGSPGVNDVDGDRISNTVADVAAFYYKNDLSPLANDVALDLPQENDLLSLPQTNVAAQTTIQHMITFTVAFGVRGNLEDNNTDGNPDKNATGNDWSVPGIPDKDGDWGDPRPRSSAAKIDDLWHASYNSAGIFASASSPTEVSERLINAISAVSSRLGSAAAVALNSGTLNANSRLYRARFNSSGWSGNLFSIPIQDGFVDVLPAGNPDGDDDSPPECDNFQTVGELCDPEWNAAEELAGITYTSRKIFTMSIDTATTPDTYTPVAFDVLSNLGTEQQAALDINPDNSPAVDGRAQDRLDYIRGDHSNESDATNGIFRVRNEVIALDGTTGLGQKNKMGDIVHSAPTFVGAPNFFYPESIETESYAKFKFDNRARTGIVYVGANDGMLHAFNASSGKEAFAYIPGVLVDKLGVFTSTSYNNQHQYFVDGSPIVFDAFNGTAWKTMLASSLGAGGQAVFGLDVTDPDTFNASNVAWEFTDNPRAVGAKKYGDEDMGYTMGDVSFAKMNNGDWAAIFGNGYNNTEDDDFKSALGNGAVYVVNAFTGELIHKFDTGVGWAEDPVAGAGRPNGVASVTPVDIDGDFKVDYLYAGDLFGNLWKMDVSPANENSWTITKLFVATGPDGEAQPITSGVAVKSHPVNRDQSLVLFGTGKYMELSDNANSVATTDIQSFYTISDNNTGSIPDKSALLQQEILAIETVPDADDTSIVREFRVTSFKATGVDWATQRGWYMDLRLDPEYGEQVLVTPVVRNNRVVFVTQTVSSGACDGGGSSWLMELDANTGNRLLAPPFDVNGDGIINDSDVVDYLGNAETITSGVRLKNGISAGAGYLSNGGKPTENKYLNGTQGTERLLESANAEYRQRQSWRQLR